MYFLSRLSYRGPLGDIGSPPAQIIAESQCLLIGRAVANDFGNHVTFCLSRVDDLEEEEEEQEEPHECPLTPINAPNEPQEGGDNDEIDWLIVTT